MCCKCASALGGGWRVVMNGTKAGLISLAPLPEPCERVAMALRLAPLRLSAPAAPPTCRRPCTRCACPAPLALARLTLLAAQPQRGPRPAPRCARRGRVAAAAKPAAAAATADVIDADATVIDTRVPVTVITGFLGCAPAPHATSAAARNATTNPRAVAVSARACRTARGVSAASCAAGVHALLRLALCAAWRGCLLSGLTRPPSAAAQLGQDDAAEPHPDGAARQAHRGDRERVWRD